VIARLRLGAGTKPPISAAAGIHGHLRRKQGYTVAMTVEDMQSLIVSAESFGVPGILVPSRNSSLLRWCLANGLQVIQPMTLMSIGLYNEPVGAWLPSVLF
jgi:hypothetical protein